VKYNQRRALLIQLLLNAGECIMNKLNPAILLRRQLIEYAGIEYKDG